MKPGTRQSLSTSLLTLTLWVAMTLAVLPSCSKQAESTADVPPAPSTASQPIAGDADREEVSDERVIQAQQEHLQKVQVTFSARVKKLLKDDLVGEQHQKFLVILSNGTTVLVAHNISMAPRVPLQAGDTVTLSGEFIWNKKGGVLHWTHKSDTVNHQSGWIEYAGQRYE